MLASGSRGNAALIRAGGSGILIDVGIGTAAAETYDIVATSGNNPINVTINGNHALNLSEIEDIIVQTNGGGDTVNVSGDFGATDLPAASAAR